MPSTAGGAEAFNRQLRETAAVLAGHAGGGYPYAFVCECGCEQVVKISLREYDREGGAWLQGHEPEKPLESLPDS